MSDLEAKNHGVQPAAIDPSLLAAIRERLAARGEGLSGPTPPGFREFGLYFTFGGGEIVRRDVDPLALARELGLL